MLATKEQFAALVDLFKSGTKLTYRRGEFVIRPGESPNSVYYIESGLIKAYSISKYGEENLLIIRKEQEVFPLIWGLTGSEREIIYQAISPATVRRIDKDKFDNFIRHNPDAILPLLDMVTEMYRIHSERILNLEYRSVKERLASFLLTMKDRFGKETSEGVVIDVPLRQQDIASSINASRETASRALSSLEKRGMIATKQFFITLKDIDALQDLL